MTDLDRFVEQVLDDDEEARLWRGLECHLAQLHVLLDRVEAVAGVRAAVGKRLSVVNRETLAAIYDRLAALRGLLDPAGG